MPNRIGLCLGILASYAIPNLALAQTCSCAAVPLLGSMQSASPRRGETLITATYGYQDISDLVAGTSSFPDTTGRDRTSDSLILEAGFGFRERWGFSVLASAVEHHRQVGETATKSSGVGDAIFIARYTPRRISLYSDSTLSYGVGARLPLGRDGVMRNGVVLAEDLQPSTGASGGVAWMYWARAMNDSGNARVYASANYAANGDNDRRYRFGNEFSVLVGGTVQTRSPWGFGIGLSYRNADRDRRDSAEVPNTGGEWLDLDASVHYRATDALTVSAGARYPISRDLNDALQFTTKYALRMSISYAFSREQ